MITEPGGPPRAKDTSHLDPVAADVEIGLAGAREGVGRRVDHCGIEVRAGGVAGTGGVNSAVCAAELVRDRRPVVEVDYRRRGADCGDAVRPGVVTDEHRHLVAVRLQIRQYVRADETG